jgi:hypothetical protein
VFLEHAGKTLSTLDSGSAMMMANISYNCVKICHPTNWVNSKNRKSDSDAVKSEACTVDQGSKTYSPRYNVIWLIGSTQVCVYYFLQYLPLATAQPIPSATTVTLIPPGEKERRNSNPILK